MKKIGLIGGISWVSTIDYYRYINTLTNDATHGQENAECIIYSLNYADIMRNNAADGWDDTLERVAQACQHLTDSGAELLLLCANTMHFIAEPLQARAAVPILHIAEVTAEAIVAQHLTKVGLLGTKTTMEKAFFRDRLAAKGIQTLIPADDDDRAFIHRTIGEELGNGRILPATKARYLSIIEALIAEGAQGIILGCTEIPLLIQPEDVRIPTFDTTLIHATAAVQVAMSASIV